MDLINRNTSTSTFFLRHGKEPLISDLENYRFDQVVFADGTTLENVTFDELTNAVWTLVNKSSAGAITLINRNV